MTKKSTYNPDDPDLRLARYLDRLSGSGSDSDHIAESSATDDNDRKQASDELAARHDPLLPLLSAYKNQSEYKVRAEASPRVLDNVMMHVTQGISRESKPIIPKESKHKEDEKVIQQLHARTTTIWKKPAVLWRIAAVLISVSFLGLYIFMMGTEQKQPELLVESGNSMKEWALPDESRVTLRPHSALYRITESENEQRYQINGEGYFEIQSIDHRAFIVQAGEAMVRVTGTRFSLRTWDDITSVFLEEGSIVFSRDDGSGETPLTPGQFSMIQNNHISAPESVAHDVYLGWLKDELVLDSRRLEDVTREISHHFGITIFLPATLRDVELSGTLLLDDPEHILDDLATSLGAEYQEVASGHYRIFEPDTN